jgi:formylglycine-generating enzyme required for sulfatase activity
MAFIYIEGDTYTIGCGSWTSDCGEDEKQRTNVELDGFWMGRREVTVKQWNQFVNKSNYKGGFEYEYGCNDTGKPDFTQGEDHPVVCVTWNDANAYASWLSKETGLTFALPSEAQWEFACRSGGKEVKYGTKTGELSPQLANYFNNEDGYDYTAPAGSFPENAVKLYDMTGNVWEWVQDFYDSEAYNSSIYTKKNPIYIKGGANRVVRGGSWNRDESFSRCANRSNLAPASRNFVIGFRLVRF